jgi:ATP-dependent RNA helicase HelY
LRLDQPLLIAEAIRKGALDGTSPETLAGGLAPFVWDRFQEVELRVGGDADLSPVEDLFDRLLESVRSIKTLKHKRGFDNPPILFWPAAALYLWAGGMSWEDLLETASVDEGDMASLIMRTADHLRQVTGLKETHPELASQAEAAVAVIMREPVYIE